MIIRHDHIFSFIQVWNGGVLILHSYAFFVAIPLLELLLSPSRIPSSFPILYPVLGFWRIPLHAEKTSKLRYPITKFCVSRIPHCSCRSNWPDLLPGLLKCRILLSTGKSLFIEHKRKQMRYPLDRDLYSGLRRPPRIPVELCQVFVLLLVC